MPPHRLPPSSSLISSEERGQAREQTGWYSDALGGGSMLPFLLPEQGRQGGGISVFLGVIFRRNGLS